MYRVTRKQKIVQGGNVIEFEDSTELATLRMAYHTQSNTIDIELMLGARYYGPDKVIFETPTFYRSVQVTIEEIKCNQSKANQHFQAHLQELEIRGTA